ncbi:ATP-binding cassette sub-family G member 1-like [Chironomus tepperi]|uniref:ATP-binding cassette sub-family G member 1-like n=1 Tax=Chironomus tepperi TaxID=113505 RepID=UPI00391F272C
MGSVYNLSFKNVCYCPKSYYIPFSNKEPKQILKNVCGEFRGNELSAIIGLSGSGKSSLLDCLSGFREKNVSGSFMLNGSPVSKNAIKRISSYVMQEHTLHTLLTINEIMNLSINLRDKEHLCDKEKEEKIRNMLEKLSITSRSNTYIKDLSGGERKRVQIAVELVTDTSILFVDECTTGLDSSASTQCIHMLQMLAKEGKTIICTIHQPSASMLKMFDHIYALADGNCIYQGAGENLIHFFRELNLPCPETYNPADFLVELANNDYGLHNHRLTEKIENGNNLGYRHVEMLNNNNNSNSDSKHTKNENIQISSQSKKYAASYFWQVYYIMCRSYLITSRDSSLFYIRFFIHVLVGLLFGHIYQDVGNKGTAIFDNYRYLVVSVVFLLYTSYHSLFIAFPIEFPIIKREHFNGWYSSQAYYTAFVIFDLPILLLCCLSYTSITYWMTDQPRELNRFVMFVGFSIFMSIAAQSLGIMVTALMNLKMANILGTFFLTPFFLFSSIMITTKDALPLFQIFFYGNFLDCGLKGVVNSVLGFNRSKLKCDEIYCHYMDPKKVLRDFGANVDIFQASSILLLYILFCQATSFILFRYRLKNFST